MMLRSNIANTERPSPTSVWSPPTPPPRVARLAQQPQRTRVVKQDATLDVAHDHALRELGHQCGEAIALLLEVRIGLAHARFHFLFERFPQRREVVEIPRQALEFERATLRGTMRRVCREHHARVLAQLARGDDVAAKQGAQQESRGQEQHGRDDRRGNRRARARPA